MENDNPNYVLDLPLRTLHPDEVIDMRSKVAKRLRNITNGFLAVDEKSGHVTWFHSLAKDFIDSQEAQEDLVTDNPRGNPALSLLKAHIAAIKTGASLQISFHKLLTGVLYYAAQLDHSSDSHDLDVYYAHLLELERNIIAKENIEECWPSTEPPTPTELEAEFDKHGLSNYQRRRKAGKMTEREGTVEYKEMAEHEGTTGHERFSCLPEFVDYLVGFLPKLGRSSGPSVEGRVHWTSSDHGLRLYDDFERFSSQSGENLESELRSMDNPQSHPRPQAGFSDWTTTLVNYLNQGVQIALRLWGSNGNSSLPLHAPQQQTSSIASNNSRILHVLYCVHDSRTGIRFHQERLDNISTDRELFSFFKAQYHRHQNHLPWFRFRYVSDVSLNKFEVDLSYFAQIHKHNISCVTECVCLPPVEKLNIEYVCEPAPRVPPPRIPVYRDNYLLHFFKKPDDISENQKTVYRQLPKRTSGRLNVLDNERQPIFGWGVYFEEGWHWESIYFMILILFVTGSLVFGLLGDAWKLAFGVYCSKER
ncbi:hypothetical protein F5Y13DRAFT_190837 [Hypoxylon sp. FL1857]|nr:hypothetical protein F5Y13DRAFT_190837 [Hypoxylon sp. FL1857]